MKKLFITLTVLLSALMVGCSSGDKMSPTDEKKMADGFQHPPKLEDLPADERARVEGMMKAHMAPPSKPAGKS